MCPALRGFTGLLLTRISSPGFQVPGSDRTRSMMLATCAAEPVLSGETKKPPITERPLMTLQQRPFDKCPSQLEVTPLPSRVYTGLHRMPGPSGCTSGFRRQRLFNVRASPYEFFMKDF